MARFILDEVQQMVADKLVPIAGVIDITCIDETNANQFHKEGRNNVLTHEQIRRFNEVKTGFNLVFDTEEFGIVLVREAMIDCEGILEEGVSIITEDDELHEFIR